MIYGKSYGIQRKATAPVVRPVPTPAPVDAPQSQASWTQLRALIAIPLVAITVFILAYSSLFGQIGILIIYVSWLPLVLIKGLGVVMPKRGTFPVFALLAWSCFSTMWSDHPLVTLRAGLETASMVACSFIIARTVALDVFVKGVIAGVTVALIVTLSSGYYTIDAFSGQYALTGWFGSKNQVGLFAELGIIFAGLLMFGTGSRVTKLLYGLPPIALALVCLKLCHSGTSVASLAATILVLGAAFATNGLPPRFRSAVVITGAVIFPVVAAVAMTLGFQDVFLHLLGKDATLTGRTQLWATGLDVGMRSPIGGTGYRAFWVIGNPAAEKLWFDFGITGKGGFHFHDTYVEAFAELGFVGLLLTINWVAATLLKSVRLVLKYGMRPEVALGLGLSVMFLIRSFVELDFFGEFGIGVLLMVPLLPTLYAFEVRARKDEALS